MASAISWPSIGRPCQACCKSRVVNANARVSLGKHAGFRALLAIVGQHFGVGLSLYTQRFWRVGPRWMCKQQVDASNALKEGKSEAVSNSEQIVESKQNVSILLQDGNGESLPDSLEGGLLKYVALVKSADAALDMISLMSSKPGRVLTNKECSQLIQAALAQNNAELSFSILSSMQSSQIQKRVDMASSGDRGESGMAQGWRWPQPDIRTYISLVRGLAASLRVNDAIRVVHDVKCRGIPVGNEVQFGKVIKCPTCDTALTVVQPHYGIQCVPCSKCRYKYELMSGDVVRCESESVSMDISALERGFRALQLKKRPLPAAIHSFVVKSPSGLVRTHRFATESVDVPAAQGNRVTVASAAPVQSGQGRGPFKASGRVPGWRPSEPMSMTNHATGHVSPLLRAPPKSGSGAAMDTSVIIPLAFLLASSDAATALIDPSLPRTIAVSAAAATILGTAANAFIVPQLDRLPERTVSMVAIRQHLLAQYEAVQSQLHDLTQEAVEEVRMLARICQLQNKMEAMREPTYSARMERLSRAQEGLDKRLAARLEIIDSYAKVSSMIEIEVEMDLDVFAVVAGGSVADIEDQLAQLAEVENLQKQWRMQAEVNDELERLLQSSSMLPDWG